MRFLISGCNGSVRSVIVESKKIRCFLSGLKFLFFFFLLFSGRIIHAQTIVTFTTGQWQWQCPAGITSITVESWGAGGAGGGVSSANGKKEAAGGGGGGYTKATVTVIPGTVYNVYVGAGGLGVSAAKGGDGGSSYFNTTTTALANGGGGGNYDSGNAGTGGTGTTQNGGSGAKGSGSTSGGGGGGAGSTGNGGNASGGTGGAAGTGTGGGQGAAGASGTLLPGNDGSAFGGGGSGASKSSGTSVSTGGNGGDGQVVITYGPGNNFIDYTNGTHGTVCNTADENNPGPGPYSVFTAPTGTVFTTVNFSSYGTPNGVCNSFQVGSCNSINSQPFVEGLLLGNGGSVNVSPSNGEFTDPCVGTLKRLYVLATYTQPICYNTSPGTITGTTPTGGSPYSYSWEQSTTNSSTGFTTVGGNTINYSPGNLTQTTWFRRKVTSGGNYIYSPVLQISVLPATVPTAVTTPTCVGGSTGTINASASGGTAPFTYSLNSGTYQSGNTFSGLTAGTYTLAAKSNEGCIGSASVIVSSYPNSTDDQTATGTNTWIGHMYSGMSFNNYIGHFTEAETFDEGFGGDYNCFTVSSGATYPSIYTEQFSVRFRMNSSRDGLYVADLGSDDGSRLYVDGTLIYNNWVDQSFSTRPSVLMNLTGASSLIYEFYENGGQNRVIFNNFTLILANNLSSNTTQTICSGNTGSAISGDSFGTLPSGISLSGTGYQWTYSTTPTGTRTNITGATSATYSPNTSSAPFNVAGTYYIYRNAKLSSTNNTGSSPYVATNESNAATITVNSLSVGGSVGSNSNVCSGVNSGTVTLTGQTGNVLKWQYSINGGTNWTDIANTTTSQSFSNLAQTTLGRAVVQSGVCASANSSAATITVNPVSVGGTVSSSASVCSGTNGGTLNLTGNTGSVIRWEYSTNGGSTWSTIANITASQTYSNITQTTQYRAVVQSGVCSSANSSAATITVNSVSVGGTVGSSASVCSGTNSGTLNLTGNTGSVIRWEYSINGGSTWSTIANTTASQTYSNIIQTTQYRAVAQSGLCSSANSSAATITVNPVPSATISYSGSPFCAGGATGTVTLTGTAGGTYSSTAGLSINAVTGAITPSSSTVGTYTVTYTMAAVGGCSAQTATTPVTINATPSAPTVTTPINYCLNAVASPLTATGTNLIWQGGNVSGAGGGTATLSSSVYIDGTYSNKKTNFTTTVPNVTITNVDYYIGPWQAVAGMVLAIYDNSGTPVAISSTTTTLNPGVGSSYKISNTFNYTISTAGNYSIGVYAGYGNIGYDNPSFPITESTGTINVTGVSVSGYRCFNNIQFTASNGSGAPTPSTSSTGTTNYMVSQTVNGCVSPQATIAVIVNTPPSATILYSSSSFCKSVGTAQAVTQSGTSGGAYSTSPSGLTINPSTGAITPSSSTAGTYTVTYTMAAAGGCSAQTATTSVTITTTPSATISYSGSPFCINSGSVSVTQTGTTGGTYSSTSGLSINSSTGAINLNSSSAGSYTVTYTIAASGGCAIYSTTTSITITPSVGTPVFTLGSTSSRCQGAGSVTYTATAANSGSITYSLDATSISGGNSINSSTGTVTYSAGWNGTSTITASASGCGGPVTSIHTATTGSIPSVSATTTYTCVGGSSGTITASGSGGSTPYTYSLNGGSYQSSNLFTGLAAGTYTLSIKSNTGCTVSAPASITVSPYPNSTDDQTATATNSWVGHIYNGMNFQNYIGHFTEAETFNEGFGGDQTCFSVSSGATTPSVFTDNFSVRFRMNSTRKGLYVVDLGSDDGSRLTVDGNLIYNNWSDQAFSTRPRVLMNFTGTSSLVYEFYENGGQNQVIFQNLTQVLANTLSTNTTQTICVGGAGAAISGDTYGTLPAGISLSGTGYQWSYSTTPGGTRNNIAGATSATYTPNTTAAPFNVVGIYYIYRNAAVSSSNNTGVNPYVATNESNAATISINALSVGGSVGTSATVCSGSNSGTLNLTGQTGSVIRWESSVNGGASWTAIANTTTAQSYTNLTQTTQYRAVVQNGACSSANSSVTTITVNAVSAGGSVGTNATVCSGSNSGTVNLTGQTGSVLRWEISTDGGTTWSAIANTTTSQAYSNLTQTTMGRAVVQNGLCASANSTPVTITVNPVSVGGSVSSNATVCSGTNSGTLNLTGQTGNVIRWESSLDGGTTWTIVANTTTSQSYSNLTQTTQYRAVVQSGVCLSANSSAATITVSAIPSVSATTTYTCVGGSSGTIIANGSGGSTPYTYSLNGGSYQSSNLFTGLAAGTYSLSIKSNAGCTVSAPASITVSPYPNSTDDQTATGANTWIGHMYSGMSFNNYIGHFTEAETFDEGFGGDYNCFTVSSGATYPSIYTEQFSVRFRMNSSRDGLYVADLGSDDGSRLYVDGTLLYNNWVDQSFSTRPSVLMNLTGSSSLIYEYYENAISNRVIFNNLKLILANNLSSNTTQSICTGNTGSAIGGDSFGTLPSGISLSGTGYQWTYSSTPTGARTNISGATSATYSPNSSSAPFNVPGTYYIYRNAILSSSNNTGVSLYVTTNESNAAIITVISSSVGGSVNTSATVCSGTNSGTLNLTGNTGSVIRWEYSTNGGASWTTIANTTTSQNYSNITLTTQYRAVVQSGVCNSANSIAATITVNPVSVGGAVNSSATVCSGTNSGTLNLTGNTGSVIRWEYSTNGGATWTTIANTTTSQNYSNITLTTQYRAVVQSGVCSSANSSSITITVNPISVGGTVNSSATVCSGTNSGTLNLTGNTGSVIRWEYSTNGGATWTTIANTTASQNYSNITLTTQYRGVVQSGVCTSANSSTATITINPVSVGGTVIPTSTVCSGTNSGTLNLTGNTGSVIRWEYSTNGGSIWTTIANTTTSQTYSNITQTTQYRAVVQSGVCASANSNPGTITVNPVPSASISYSGSPFCSGGATGTVTQTGTTGGTYSSTSGLVINSLTGAIDVSSSNPGNYTVTYNIAAGACAAYATTTNVLITLPGSWIGAVSADWNDSRNWLCGQIPNSTIDATISAGASYYPNITSGVMPVRDININSGGTLTVGGGTLQIFGSIANSGTFDASNGAIEMHGASPQTIPAGAFTNNDVKNLIISNTSSGGVTVAGNVDVYQSLTYGAGGTKLNTGGYITLKSNASETAWVGDMTGHTITGDVTVERYVAAIDNWQFLAVPTQTTQTIHQAWQENQDSGIVGTIGYGTNITGPTGGIGFDFTSPNYSMKYWDGIANSYKTITNTGIQFPNIKNGFFIYIRGDRRATASGATTHQPTVMRTKGPLYTGTVNFTIPANTYYSIGNPYASRTDFSSVSGITGVGSTFYVWDPLIYGARGAGGYQTLSAADGYKPLVPTSYYDISTPVPYLESGQAAFVYNPSTSSPVTITFAESNKATGSHLAFKTADVSASEFFRTYLVTSSGKIADGNAVVFNIKYQDKIDANDARKISNTGENLGLRMDGIVLAIEARAPLTVRDTIFYDLRNVSLSTYNFQFSPENMQDEPLNAFLLDNYLKTSTAVSLAGTTNVNFTVNSDVASYAADRFMVVFRQATTASVASVLPVTFVSIKAVQKNEDVVVSWNVANENNLLQYEVEKSTDGTHFEKVATVAANNNGSANYQWIDKNASSGYNYYRVVSIDKDNKTSYSTVVNVLMPNLKPSITIYPNPITDGIIHLQLVNQPEGRYGFRLLNPLGQVLVSKQSEFAGGNGSENIQWNYNLPHGVYQMEITRPDGSVTVIRVLY